jgi:TolB protein
MALRLIATCAALLAVMWASHSGATTSAARERATRNGLIAFVSARGGIAVIGPDRRGFRRLTRDRRDRAPAWSPNGRWILFARGRDLFLIAPAGAARPRKLTRGLPSDAWSPDSRRIAFERDGDLFTIRVDGTGLHGLARTPDPEMWPSWSPDGRRIAYIRGGNLIVARRDGWNAHAIYEGGELGGPTWSPDGRTIAFSESGEVIIAIAPEGGEPWLLDADVEIDDEGVQVVDGTQAEDANPVWSPNGPRIAFSRTLWLCPRCDETGVWTIRADGTHATQLVSVGDWPAWSPDGRKVVLELNGGLSVFAAEGGDPGAGLVAHGSQPAWQPRH